MHHRTMMVERMRPTLLGDDSEHQGVLGEDLGRQACHPMKVRGGAELPDE